MNKIRLFLCVLCAMILLTACTSTHVTETIDNYLTTDIPLTYTEYLLFPQAEALAECTVNQYRSVSKSSLLFDDVYFLLRCQYSDAQYENEVMRLQQLGAEYCDENFPYPAYVMLLYGDSYYEYALLDVENREIIYVSAQTSDLAGFEDFPTEYLPYDITTTDVCKY